MYRGGKYAIQKDMDETELLKMVLELPEKDKMVMWLEGYIDFVIEGALGGKLADYFGASRSFVFAVGFTIIGLLILAGFSYWKFIKRFDMTLKEVFNALYKYENGKASKWFIWMPFVYHLRRSL
ncbi:MAG: hypothetical protein Q8934_16640 [Bacillota bacterium]|nr:hypothetical protein [Bacillota bacterium]